MTGKRVTPFNLYRANLTFALQMLGFSLEARQQACDFEMQRIRRDVAAVHGMRNAASAAHDLSKLTASCGTAARDYMATTTNLWQQGVSSAMRLQSAYSQGLREALATWQSAWSDQWPMHAPNSPAVLLWQEWLQRIQHTAAQTPYGPTGGDDASQDIPDGSAYSGRSPPSGGRAQQGEHHVG
ncbi:hypothetical protein PQR02_31410 [Paraburkholderia sediminicola]|uniref:Uncharacterized protein n=1 Tax=Paraburkholderia rhynchosiae TaxID=487049 RepID=A0ACC7NPC6_9BURK